MPYRSANMMLDYKSDVISYQDKIIESQDRRIHSLTEMLRDEIRSQEIAVYEREHADDQHLHWKYKYDLEGFGCETDLKSAVRKDVRVEVSPRVSK